MLTFQQRQQSAMLERMADKILNHADRKPKRKNAKAFGSTGQFFPLCNCDVLPWEDCEHTDALADKAMREQLSMSAEMT